MYGCITYPLCACARVHVSLLDAPLLPRLSAWCTWVTYTRGKQGSCAPPSHPPAFRQSDPSSISPPTTHHHTCHAITVEIIACGGAPFLIDHYAVTYGLTLPPGAAELVMFLLQPDPRDRPTVEDVLLHPWVNDGVEGQQQRQWRPPAVISETRDVQKQ